MTQTADRVWRLGTSAVVLAFVLDPFGNLPNSIVLALVTLTALQVLTTQPFADSTNAGILAISAIIVVIAALEILHPAVPTLTVGLVGFRKTATVILGLIIGLGWRGSRMFGLRLVWWCLFISACVSLFVFLAFPNLEDSIARGAEEYTSVIGGVERMQGLLAGPFHVSMLGVFLVLAGLAGGSVIQQRSFRYCGAAVGILCVYYSQVRTGLVALALGVLVMMLATGSAQRWANRLLAVAALAVLAIIYVQPLTDYAKQFTALRLMLEGGLDDSRFTSRFDTWSTGIDMVNRSPFLGNGSGSAGDTLGPLFASGDHVTSHNTFLKYAVEGGLLQGILFLVLCFSVGWAMRPSREPTHFGIAAGVSFIVFGLVGAAPEALPVSFALAVIMGLCIRTRDLNSRDSATEAIALDPSPDAADAVVRKGRPSVFGAGE